MQKERERLNDSRFTAVVLGRSRSSPSSGEEFKCTDLNSTILFPGEEKKKSFIFIFKYHPIW